MKNPFIELGRLYQGCAPLIEGQTPETLEINFVNGKCSCLFCFPYF